MIRGTAHHSPAVPNGRLLQDPQVDGDPDEIMMDAIALDRDIPMRGFASDMRCLCLTYVRRGTSEAQLHQFFANFSV